MFLVVLLFLGRQSGRLCVRFIFAENYFSHFFQVPHSRQFASQHFTIFFFVYFSLLLSKLFLTVTFNLLLFQVSFFLLSLLSYLLLNNAQPKNRNFCHKRKHTIFIYANLLLQKPVGELIVFHSEILTTINHPIFFSVPGPTFGGSRPLAFVVVLSSSTSCLNLLLEILPLLPARLHDRGDVLHAGESWGQRPDKHHEQNYKAIRALPPLIRAMPERMHFFPQETVPYVQSLK